MLEHDLRAMARHLVDVLNQNRETILVPDDNSFVFKQAVYGEPTVIMEWPAVSVNPMSKARDIKATRKYEIVFEIHLILYHGQVASVAKIQEETHKRAEALENFILADRFWNYVDIADSTKHKVIHGMVTSLDHPFVDLGESNLWSASRLICVATSEENF